MPERAPSHPPKKNMTAAAVLVSAYDDWVREEQPDAASARAPLRALQQAIHECHRKGGRLASVPLLLEEKNLLQAGAASPVPPVAHLSSLLPDLPPSGLLGGGATCACEGSPSQHET